MTNMIEPRFGRLTPTSWEHVEKYPYSRLGIREAAVVEKRLPVPALVRWYDQKETNACVGFSCSWMMSIYNSRGYTGIMYDANWLYREARLADGAPETDPPTDVGTFLWAGMQVLRSQGHVWVRKPEKVNLHSGVDHFWWCLSVDEMRTEIASGRPVVLGINWYQDFMTPEMLAGEFWIGRRDRWGNVLGGHAICCYGASDGRQAFRLVNTWGSYPKVWLPYEAMRRLMGEQGECCTAMDR